MLKILGRANSLNVRKVLWACDEMNIPYEREDWGAGFRPTQSPEFLALNPNALVPVVIDGDVVLRESNTIVRYLATREGRDDLLPHAPAGRAFVELWMDWQATEFNNAWLYAFMALVRKNPAYADSAAIAKSVATWTRHMAILEDRLHATNAYVVGKDFTVADIGIGLSVHRWFMTPIQRAPFPAAEAYYERLSQRPAFLRHGRNGVP